jgi:pentatricopeptide repeat protein
MEEAKRLSPDLPAAYFELSKANLSFKPIGMFETVDYMLKGIMAYQKNFWWSFMLATSLFISITLSFIIAFLLIIIIRIPQEVSFLTHDILESKSRLFLLFILIFSVFGPLYLMGGILIVFSVYMKKWDKIVVYLFVFFLLLTPWIFHTFAKSLNAPTSNTLKAIVQVNESRGNEYALSVLEDSTNTVERFSYALALKRSGRYREAIDIYERLLAIGPDSRVYNNLANCYVALRDLEKAKDLYKKSISIHPMPTSLYNLSQVHRATLEFNKGEEYFLAAQKLDRDVVWDYREIYSTHPNRFVIDMGLSIGILWKYFFRNVNGVFPITYTMLPPVFWSGIALVMGALLYLANRLYRYNAYRCNRCGAILCNKCEKRLLWGNMCLPCYRSLVKLDELDSRERITRILTVYEYRKKRRDILKILAYVLPGSAQIYAGDILYGFFLLWPFLFLLFVPIMNLLFNAMSPGFSHLWINILSLFLLFILYFASNIMTRRRLAKGWL